ARPFPNSPDSATIILIKNRLMKRRTLLLVFFLLALVAGGLFYGLGKEAQKPSLWSHLWSRWTLEEEPLPTVEPETQTPVDPIESGPLAPVDSGENLSYEERIE